MNWLEMLRAQVAAKGLRQVCREIKYSKATVSLVLNDKYPSPTGRIEARVIERYTRVNCPFLRQELTGDECASYRSKASPTSDPRAIQHWAACQSCHHNPANQEAAHVAPTA